MKQIILRDNTTEKDKDITKFYLIETIFMCSLAIIAIVLVCFCFRLSNTQKENYNYILDELENIDAKFNMLELDISEITVVQMQVDYLEERINDLENEINH